MRLCLGSLIKTHDEKGQNRKQTKKKKTKTKTKNNREREREQRMDGWIKTSES